MNGEGFDRLARAIAAPRSRRGLLGVLAGSVVAAVTGAFQRPSPVAAKRRHALRHRRANVRRRR
jgi:hypothetical protein